MNRVEQMQKVQSEGLELFKKKNTDYGDSFADYGAVGVLVRMLDKIKRFMSVSNNGISLVNDEALRDTLIDLMNYSAMAIMLMDENPKKLDGYNTPISTLVDNSTKGEWLFDEKKV